MLPAGMSHQPDNIFAGTQIVLLAESRGTNHSLVHPRGAIGIVTRTPTNACDAERPDHGLEKRFLFNARRQMASHK